MIIINSIEISNFRSIVRLDPKVIPNHLNIIVGQNDIGKSNFLKALNLFFNGETEIGNSFRFSEDFSKFAKTPRKKAQEITIRIEFQTPERFKNSESLIWTKVWRQEGLFKDEILTRGGKLPSGRGGAMQWVKKIKFKYVPAIRGTEYFNYLMGDLHDALSEINPSAFNEASGNFIDGLKSQVALLVENITTELGYSSQIGMPGNFKLLFSTLDFSLDKNGQLISLNRRGDGIKAQHIPIILKFIASHYKSVTGKAIINPDTIWGFEEPENNMEMGNAFKLAKIFASFSKDLQIFINTHSPAFYSLAKESTAETTLYLAKSYDANAGTNLNIVDVDNIEVFDQEMGILPIISDYVKKEVDLRISAERKVEELSKLKSNTKYLVLSEDQDLNYVKSLFKNQGFDDIITEFISYQSRGNLLAAMQSCKIPLTNKPDLTDVIFHRDRDIYDNDEPDLERIKKSLSILNESDKIRYHVFLTENYDIESYFINAQHVHSLYPELSIEEVNNLIKEATIDTKDKSIDKLLEKTKLLKEDADANGQTYKFSYSQAFRDLTSLYENNPERYRYGKTVLGRLYAKLQHRLKKKIDLLQTTDSIDIPMLRSIINHHQKT